MSYGAALVGSDFGRGTAYRAELPFHRLNVLAGRMSAFPDRADDLSTGWWKTGSLTIPCCSPCAVTMVFIFVTGWLACLEIGSNEPGWTSFGPRLRPVGRMARADSRLHLTMVSSCARRMSFCVSVSALRVCRCKLRKGRRGATTYHRPLLAAGMVVQNQSRGSYLHPGVGPDDDRSGFDSEGKKTSRVDPCSVPSRPGVASACQPAVTVSRAEFT